MLVELPVVEGAEGDGELVRDLAPEGGGLRELQVMGVGAVAAADQAGLRGDEGEVPEVADAAGLGEGQG